VFLDGLDGIGLAIRNWPESSELRISNNTFLSSYSWIAFDSESVIGGSPTVVNNLILGSKLIGMTAKHQAYAADAWTIHSNHWERGIDTPTGAGRDSTIATLHEPGTLEIVRDPQAKDFLVPPPGSELLTSGYGDGLPTFVGAKDRID
jgi:hypothetical protein